MRIAVPIVAGKVSSHFGRCDEFALVDAESETRAVLETRYLKPPAHEPGVFPKWLADNGADVIIAGGMGRRAQALFEENGISVVSGAPADDLDDTVQRYLEGTLETGDGDCGH